MTDPGSAGDSLAQALSLGPVPPIPDPAERTRLREAWGWSKQQLADEIGVKRETVWAWEKPNAPAPRGAKGQAYARLLDGMRRQLAAVGAAVPEPQPLPQAQPSQGALPGRAAQGVRAEQMPATPATAAVPDTQPLQEVLPDDVVEMEVPEPAPAPSAPTGLVPYDDPDSVRHLPDGSTRSCARCGRPTSILVDGEPRHLYTSVSAAVAPPCWITAVPAALPAAAPAAPAPAMTEPAPAPLPRAEPPASEQAPATFRRASPRLADATFSDGPLAVLEAADGHLVAHLVDGRVMSCPVKSIPALAAWTLDKTQLGSSKLHHHGFDGDPLIVLTAGAAEYLGLPPALEDRSGLRLDAKHKIVKQITQAGWELPYRGFGPWPRVFQRVERGRRSVQLAVLPWDALEKRAWGDTVQQPAPEIARRLGLYAERVITPRGTTGVSSLELMASVRPKTRAEKDEETGTWHSAPVAGSLQAPVDPAPPEAPDEHPLIHELFPGGRPHSEVLDEEACQWVRPFDLITPEEAAFSDVVALDLITAFLAAANNVRVGLGPAQYVENPRFDKDLPGSWWVDLSHVEVDPRLPNPFTPSGLRPTGPAWYATPTVAYAVELKAHVQPLKAWVRPDTGLYLTPWYERLRDAYLATMSDLGVHIPAKDEVLDERAFLQEMARHKQGDPGAVALLAAIKLTAKSGIGKLREGPQGDSYIDGEPWSALKRVLWRPDIRAAVLSRARVNMHRKMMKMAKLTGLYPLAIMIDCVVYASPGPSPLAILPHTADGKPAKGTFALGVSPGSVKHQGSESMAWALEQLEQGINIANYIGGGSAIDDGE
ncbi:telomere-associated protein Tap [Streptomyces sp. RKAG337]|uniref:telomere-associated protein Tap n=1 Tax=Streptomyces sp. RKAG337 TaxID=2893404 RepID=UPI00203441B2|nr:helix-turn-helix transcriptional regulator [Streptomyces sp. RKAG337]MCM2430981.1 helix-turn-helix domain-containing protein [Streptomyces sp. RKAG337]